MLKTMRRQIAVFFAVLGPGFITAMVDNDAGGIFTYSEAGARWGYTPLWTLIPITLALIVAQKCARAWARSREKDFRSDSGRSSDSARRSSSWRCCSW
ncbi:MAG: hypothetical protein R2748_06950 [Bryobacterales bacterium]